MVNNKKKREERRPSKIEPKDSWIKEETRNAILGIVFLCLALFLLLASFEIGGVVGKYTFKVLSFLFGTGFYLLPILLVIVGISYIRSHRPRLALPNFVGGGLFLLAGLGMAELFFSEAGAIGHPAGGIVGSVVAGIFNKLFSFWASAIFLIAIFIISLLIIFEGKLSFAWIKKLFARKTPDMDMEAQYESEEDLAGEVDEEIPAEETADAAESPKEEVPEDNTGTLKKMFGLGKEKTILGTSGLNRLAKKPYTPPPLALLENDSGRPQAGDIKANANIIKRTLLNFGIDVEMDEITVGPSITRYALKPAEGVKLSRIVALQNDLSLALAAHPIRIEAPIPGKSLVGIEIPNSVKSTVRLGSLLSTKEFSESGKPLLISLGRDTAGLAHFGDLSKMPHLLVAGSTGSGKSVAIHTMITSLLYRNSPENLRFIMIDPKRVELTLYNKIPHLLTPVITDAKKTILALKWAAKEMERRYDILEAESVRDVHSYHENVYGPALKTHRKKTEGAALSEEEITELEAKLPESLPYIVIVLDELADIMSTYPRELEAAIVRLAQMSRAVGIHLIVSTQRPSTEVITGLIKANVPSRIALQVPSQIDSRTIIDMPGAEKLLGSGDMLYMSGEMSKPRRIQSGFVSEGEVKKVVRFLIDEYADEAPDEITITDNGKDLGGAGSLFGNEVLGDDDELYEEARKIVIESQKASSSLLQRKLKVGYARAARLLDMLEERGVVGVGDGAKPRDVYEKSYGTATDTYAEEFDKNKTQDNV